MKSNQNSNDKSNKVSATRTCIPHNAFMQHNPHHQCGRTITKVKHFKTNKTEIIAYISSFCCFCCCCFQLFGFLGLLGDDEELKKHLPSTSIQPNQHDPTTSKSSSDPIIHMKHRPTDLLASKIKSGWKEQDVERKSKTYNKNQQAHEHGEKM